MKAGINEKLASDISSSEDELLGGKNKPKKSPKKKTIPKKLDDEVSQETVEESMMENEDKNSEDDKVWSHFTQNMQKKLTINYFITDVSIFIVAYRNEN